MTKKTKQSEATIRIKLVKSANNSIQKHKATVRALGLRKIGQVVEQKDNDKIRGMVHAVQHLVEVVE